MRKAYQNQQKGKMMSVMSDYMEGKLKVRKMVVSLDEHLIMRAKYEKNIKGLEKWVAELEAKPVTDLAGRVLPTTTTSGGVCEKPIEGKMMSEAIEEIKKHYKGPFEHVLFNQQIIDSNSEVVADVEDPQMGNLITEMLNDRFEGGPTEKGCHNCGNIHSRACNTVCSENYESNWKPKTTKDSE